MSEEMAENVGCWVSEKDHGGHCLLSATTQRTGCKGEKDYFLYDFERRVNNRQEKL